MYNEDFFGFHSFELGEKERDVTFVKFDTQTITVQGGKKETKTVCYVKDQSGKMLKPILWNPTNSQLTTKALKTPHPAEWIGKTVTIWPDPSVTLKKEAVGGVRVRPVAPKAAKPTLDTERFKKMLDSIEAGKFSADQAKAKFQLTSDQLELL